MLKIRCLFLVWLFFMAKGAFAQYGILDPTFGNDGKVVTVFGQDNNSFMKSLAVQPDGKIVAGGNVFIQNQGQFGLARYNLNGSLDTTFGVDGKVAVVLSEFQMLLSSIVLQPDGKIVAVGLLYNDDNSRSQFVLARYNTNGTLDTTFGTEGKVTTFINDDDNNISALAIQPDGKILATGYSTDHSSYSNFLLIRYDSNGNLDTGFGVNGIVITSIRLLDFVYTIAMQPDGKIVVAGKSSDEWDDYYGYDDDFVIVRYTINGTLDPTFGIDGKVIVGAYDGKEKALYIRIQPDGKIVIAGEYVGQLPYSFMLVHLLANGKPDPDFGINGIQMTVLPGGNIKSMQTQSDGKIVTTGDYNPGSCCSAIRLMRFLINGDLDSTFGNNGVISHQIDAGQSYSLVLQSDGKIVVSGGGGMSVPVHVDFTMYRYTSGLLSITPFDTPSNNFVLYPNPVNETINLDFNLNQSEVLSMDLYDSNGRKIINLLQDRIFPMGYNSHKIELPETLSKGIYFLNISNSRNTTSIKIMK